MVKDIAKNGKTVSRAAHDVAKALDTAIGQQEGTDSSNAAIINSSQRINTSSSYGGHGLSTGTQAQGPETAEQKAERRHKIRLDREKEKKIEAEVMGTRKSGLTSQSDIKERNLSQMIGVLHTRLATLEKTTSIRRELVQEDVKTDSKRCSNDGPKTGDDIEELVGASKKDGMKIGSQHTQHTVSTSNLVSADGIYLDPTHLVFRTRNATEAAKRLEGRLEDAFGTTNTRDFRGQKKKGASSTAQSKKNLEERNEAKKLMRLKLEKRLTTNMESFVTRSILEPELVLVTPNAMRAAGISGRDTGNAASGAGASVTAAGGLITSQIDHNSTSAAASGYFGGEEDAEDRCEWPISVKWSKADPRSANAENVDGEMDPLLLLKYSIERVALPAHENLFRWLIAQPSMQNYYVHLFWLIKLKFFQAVTPPPEASSTHFYDDGDPAAQTQTVVTQLMNELGEVYLMKQMACHYAVVIALMAERTYAEHEKDHVYKYLPFLLCNAVYYGFYFLCPGSRHLYTKGFRKTLLMQIVQVMNGIQLCPVSVKVSWAKLFPDEAHDDDEEEAGQESFPVQSALIAHEQLNQVKKALRGGTADTNESFLAPLGEIEPPPSASPLTTNGGAPRVGARAETLHHAAEPALAPRQRGGRLAGDDDDGYEMGGATRGHQGDLDSGEVTDIIRRVASCTSIGPTAGKRTTQHSASARHFAEADSSRAALPQSRTGTSLRQAPVVATPLRDFFDATSGKPTFGTLSGNDDDPLVRTYLKAPKTRPSARFTTKRQNVEAMNAQSVSPLMQSLLGWSDSAGQRVQPLFRTVPISWCPAGGADTHKKRTVNKELHDSISQRFAKAQRGFVREGALGHRRKLEAMKLVDKKKHIMLTGPQGQISQKALELIKAHRVKERGGKQIKKQEEDLEEHIDPAMAFYDDGDLDEFLNDFE